VTKCNKATECFKDFNDGSIKVNEWEAFYVSAPVPDEAEVNFVSEKLQLPVINS
jgi:hypothetical protein